MKWCLYVVIFLIIITRSFTHTNLIVSTDVETFTIFSEEASEPYMEMRQLYDPVLEIYIDLMTFNTLSLEAYQHFKGVGPSLSASIKAYIEANGPFTSFDDLTLVNGIGPKKLQQILENSK